VRELDWERLELLRDMERLDDSWDEQHSSLLQRNQQLELLERLELLCEKRLAIAERAEFRAIASPQEDTHHHYIYHKSCSRHHGSLQLEGLLALHMGRLNYLREKRRWRLEELKRWEGSMTLPEWDHRLEAQLEREFELYAIYCIFMCSVTFFAFFDVLLYAIDCIFVVCYMPSKIA
jgi:hypothetical protein